MLPPKAMEELRRAAQTPTDKDPEARAKAIDATIERLREQFPMHFKDDDHGDTCRS